MSVVTVFIKCMYTDTPNYQYNAKQFEIFKFQVSCDVISAVNVLTGFPGLAGATGGTGLSGLRGAMGDTGARGPNGDIGFVGQPGVAGAVGATGNVVVGHFNMRNQIVFLC